MNAELMISLYIWKERWEGLNQTIEELVAYYDKKSLVELPQKETIISLLRRLQLFGKSQFHFFYHGFRGDKGYQLQEDCKSAPWPPETVLRIVIDQIAYDLEVIQRAADQRLRYQGVGNVTQQALDKAAQLAQQALALVTGAKGLLQSNVAILTYFQKSPTIRVIPYAHAAVIGIPYTCRGTSVDLLAIAHEVGHYVFRHGRYQEQSIARWLKLKTKNENQYIQDWVEEIFADAFGCLVGGPVMALDFQDLQMDERADEFTRSTKDKEDPVPILRPDIYSKVIAKKAAVSPDLQVVWDKVAQILYQLWESRRNHRWEQIRKPTDGPPAFTTVNKTYTLDVAMALSTDLDGTKPLDKAILLILDYILSRLLNNTSSKWSGDIASLASVTAENVTSKLYELFDEYQKNLGSVELLPLAQITNVEQRETLFPDVSTMWLDWANGRQFFGAEPVTSALQNNQISCLEWLLILAADGWTTRGPEPNPTGG